MTHLPIAVSAINTTHCLRAELLLNYLDTKHSSLTCFADAAHKHFSIFHVFLFVSSKVWLTDIDVLSAIVAALIHDFEHTGTTNTFHINTR